MEDVVGPTGGAGGPDKDEQRRYTIAAGDARRRQNRLRLVIAAVVLAIVLALPSAVLFGPGNRAGPAPRPAGGQISDYNSTAVFVPLSSVDGTARFYKWSGAGKTIRFFAVNGSDGEVRTAFDNAYCCYRKDLGERQDGVNMVCNWCGKPFPIDGLNRTNLDPLTVGRCCPAHLRNTVVGDRIVFEKADLEAGAYMFKG